MQKPTILQLINATMNEWYNGRTLQRKMLQRTNAKMSNATTNYSTTYEVITKGSYNEVSISKIMMQ